jgi:hypothetical protein
MTSGKVNDCRVSQRGTELMGQIGVEFTGTQLRRLKLIKGGSRFKRGADRRPCSSSAAEAQGVGSHSCNTKKFLFQIFSNQPFNILSAC